MTTKVLLVNQGPEAISVARVQEDLSTGDVLARIIDKTRMHAQDSKEFVVYKQQQLFIEEVESFMPIPKQLYRGN